MQIYDGRESFYQWDLNQKITSDAFEVGDKIHFFNMRQTNALVVKAYELDGVVVADVPNILLQSALPITAWKYVYDEHSAQTVMEDTFTVAQRPQPYDYFYTETELYELRKEVDNLVIEANKAVAQLQAGLDKADTALELATQAIDAATTAEETSFKNEQGRVDAEEERASNESDRVVAEVERENAEEDRADAESTRVENENARGEAEKTRIENENARIVKESNRDKAESQRVGAETLRKSNETTRVTAESTRVTNENARTKAEVARDNAETQRLNAEQLRVEAETNRAYAEQGRIAAEEVRQANFEASQNNVGNAIKGYVSGEVVRVDDVSPIEHIAKAKVSGKNLIPYPFKDTTKTINGLTFTDNEDGSVTVNGTATAASTFSINARFTVASKGIYVLSGCPVGGSGSKYMLAINFFVDEVETTGVRDIGDGYSILLQENTDVKIYIYIAKGQTVSNLTFHPQFELGDTATEYEPYIDPTTVTLTVQDASGENVATHTPTADGVANVVSLSPTMVLSTDTKGVTIDLEYNRDTNKAMGDVKSDIQALDDAIAKLAAGEANTPKVTLIDNNTGKSYMLYVFDGKLTLAESES